MQYYAFQDELRRAGLTVAAFARLLKLNPNSITNYRRSDAVPQHLALIAALLGTLRENGIDVTPVFDRIPIASKAPRGSSDMLRKTADQRSLRRK